MLLGLSKSSLCDLQNKIFQSLERKRKIAPDLLLDLAARKLIRI